MSQSHGYGFACLLFAAALIVAAEGPATAADGPAATAAPTAEESPENVETVTVTVTGIRAAIESAIGIKQDSNSTALRPFP
jgi:hypothetical protein